MGCRYGNKGTHLWAEQIGILGLEPSVKQNMYFCHQVSPLLSSMDLQQAMGSTKR